jgi:uncharacterized protein (DUF362 family)
MFSIGSYVSPDASGMKVRAFLERVEPDGANYLDVIRRGLKFVEFGEGLTTSPRLFVKPNLTYPSYRPGVMTSIGAIEAAIVALKDFTPNIAIGDADSGGYNPFSMDEVYRETGIAAFASRHGVQVVNLSLLPRKAWSFELRGRRIEVELPKLLVDEVDALITMPVPKMHLNTQVSLTFKNQWGCIPDPKDRLRLHPHFKETILALNKAVHARYAIIDGRVGLNGSGPMNGVPVPLGWVCITNDIGAGARVCCELMRVPLQGVPHLRFARAHGLIPELEQIELNAPIDEFLGPRFYLRRKWTDIPGYLAFHSNALAYVAYFSRFAGFLHWVLYLFREPLYDYQAYVPARRGANDPSHSKRPLDRS